MGVQLRKREWTACALNVRQDAGSYDAKSSKKLRKLPYFLRNTAVLRFRRQDLHLQFPGNGERVLKMIIAHFSVKPACFQGNQIHSVEVHRIL